MIYVKYRKVASILKQKIGFASNFTKKLHCLSAMRCYASEIESLLAYPPAHPSNQMPCAQVFERSAWLGMVVSPCQSQHACGTRLRFAPVIKHNTNHSIGRIQTLSQPILPNDATPSLLLFLIRGWQVVWSYKTCSCQKLSGNGMFASQQSLGMALHLSRICCFRVHSCHSSFHQFPTKPQSSHGIIPNHHQSLPIWSNLCLSAMLDELVGKERFPSHPVHLIAVWDMLRPLVSTVWHHDCLRSAKDAKVMSPCQSQHVFGMKLELGHFVPAQLGMRAMTGQNQWAKNCMFSGEPVQLETCTHCLLYIFLFVQRQVSGRYEPRAWHRRKKVSSRANRLTGVEIKPGSSCLPVSKQSRIMLQTTTDREFCCCGTALSWFRR